MDVLVAYLLLLFIPPIAAIFLREAVSFVLRIRMALQDTFLLTWSMVAASLLLYYGAGYAVHRATQDPALLGLATLIRWTGNVVAHLAILVFRLNVTVLNATRVYALMVVGLLVVAFSLIAAFLVMASA